jgi:tRNA (mo5U34)-methyltransferase
VIASVIAAAGVYLAIGGALGTALGIAFVQMRSLILIDSLTGTSPSRRLQSRNVQFVLAMNRDELEARAKAIRWFHSIDLGDGVVTTGIDATQAERLSGLQLPTALAGKSVLDIGAWDGFFSFECERRGASRVLATDFYSWHGSGWGTKAGFTLAREARSSKVEDLDIDVMDLSPERVGMFDVVLFLGVLYHLPHPLLALEKVASVTRGTLILETVVDLVGMRRPAIAFYPGRELNDDPTNWWGPNPEAVSAMLRVVGFQDVTNVTQLPGPGYRAARAIVHRLKGKNQLGLAFRQDRAVFHAHKR